jgi:hypothetical protein
MATSPSKDMGMKDRTSGARQARNYRQAENTTGGPDPLRGAVGGLGAGLAASLAMNLSQKALAKLQFSR